MLTKKDRAAIAERLKNVSVLDGDYAVYQAVAGKSVLDGPLTLGDIHDMRRIIIDLCDTSNMIELPLDKDGEVIRIHDVVYDNTGMEREVGEFRFPFYGACIYARTDDDRSTFRPDEISHKTPVTAHKNPVIIASLAGQIRDIIDYEDDMPLFAVKNLSRIADQLERLGDSDDRG